ncbi:hypothetical protein SAMD00023353_12100100 [Rosellinia necatrix]|uniref:Uncharacterized protein n=1 Tax=Rosellinia necatrix TaxID=77044 RepID=A0A1S8ABS6_ROSNE|nr:hypothetical protein SAMD00023353_12100100 [Rosellinia necatrix]
MSSNGAKAIWPSALHLLIATPLAGAIGLVAVCVLAASLFRPRTPGQISSRSCTNKNGEQLPEIAFDVRSLKSQRRSV